MRRLRFTERESTTFNASFYNACNHVLESDPTLSLRSPSSFGGISGQYNTLR